MIKRILSVFFPERCPYCNTIIRHPMTECKKCFSELYSLSWSFSISGKIPCAVAFPYIDPFRRAILDMKFKSRKYNCESLGKAISAAASPLVSKYHPDFITCVPMSRDRLKVRGYNQSEQLAKIAARELSLPFIPLLDRHNGAKVQHELTFEERLANHDLRFYLINSEFVKDKTILLIDDIVTSGMTVSECSRLLEKGGAAKVICACASASGANFDINNTEV